MKNKRLLKAIIYSIKNDIGAVVLGMVAIFLFGMILFNVVTFVTKDTEDGMLAIGSMGSICIGLFEAAFLGGCSMRNKFNMAVGMSFTRKDFIICEVLAGACSTIFTLLLGGIFFVGETLLYKVMYTGVTINSGNLNFVKTIYSAPFIIFIIASILFTRLLIGWVLMKFKDKGIWIILCIYWGVALFASRYESISIAGKIVQMLGVSYEKMTEVCAGLPQLIGSLILCIITYIISIGIKHQDVV